MQEELVPEYIEGREFSTSLRGYDKGEVDSFLSALAAEIRDYQRANSERLYQNLGEEMGSLLQHAKDSGDAMRKEAEEEAAAVRHTAESDAQRTRAEAEHKASDIRATAEAEATERIKEAEDRVRALESVERDARGRVRALRAELEVVTAQLSGVQGESGGADLPQPNLVEEAAQIDLDEGREIALGSNEQTTH